ncbi:unnamed protein product [Diamesa serratosioi]
MPPPPMIPGKHNMDITTWDTPKNVPQSPPVIPTPAPVPTKPNANVGVGNQQGRTGGQPAWPTPGQAREQQQQNQNMPPSGNGPPQQQQQQNHATVASPVELATSAEDNPVLEQLRGKNHYNSPDLDLSLVEGARFFVIKSYSEDDIHRSIKYEIWCSTEHGNKRLDQAFREREKDNGVIYLFFSVNSSGHFCGLAQMITPVDYDSHSSVWSQDKWKGSFKVKWIYVKDVPNQQLRHIRLECNENKPVTNSRDTQEVPNDQGIQILKIVHSYKHTTSIFDDFTHYEKRQEEEDTHKHEDTPFQKTMTLPASHHSSHMKQQYEQNNRYNDRDSYNGGGRDYNIGGGGGGGNNGGGYDRGNGGGGYNGGGYDKGGYNRGGGYNDGGYKPFNNGGGRGGYQKRNEFRSNGDQGGGGGGNGGGFQHRGSKDYGSDKDYDNGRDFGGNRGGYRDNRSDRGRSYNNNRSMDNEF